MRKSILHNFLIFGFPLYLIIFELILRFFLFPDQNGIDTSAFIGPTLAAAGLSRLLPLTNRKKVDTSIHSELDEETLKSLNDKGIKLIHGKDEETIYFVWFFIVIGILLWYATCLTALKSPNWDLLDVFPAQFVFGSINYVVSIILTLQKDKL